MGHWSCGSWVNCVMGHMGRGSRKMTHFDLWSVEMKVTEWWRVSLLRKNVLAVIITKCSREAKGGQDICQRGGIFPCIAFAKYVFFLFMNSNWAKLERKTKMWMPGTRGACRGVGDSIHPYRGWNFFRTKIIPQYYTKACKVRSVFLLRSFGE